MSERESIVQTLSLPLALLISLGVHLILFRGNALWKTTPPQPLFQQGRTSVQLTLLPSRASQPATPVPSPSPPPPPKKEKTLFEQIQPAPVVLPVPKPEKATPPAMETKVQDEVSPEPDPSAEMLAPEKSVASLEQDATQIEEKGVGTEASVVRAVSPVYPRLSRRNGEEGTVWIRVWVSTKGKVEKAEVEKSSGFHRLDAAALKAARKTRFTPAQKNGMAVAAEIELPFGFKLTDKERKKR